MSRASFHVLAAAAVVGVSATLASALDQSVSFRQEINSTRSPGQITYAWRAAGTPARGKERLYITGGSGYLGDFGLSAYVTADPQDGERDPFFFSFFAPVGNGRATNSTLSCRYDTRRDDTEEREYNLADAAYVAETLDQFVAGTLGGIIIKKKRPSVAMEGALAVERLKSKGKLRRRGDVFVGSVTMQATGSILDGENAQRPFKSKLRVKIREARASSGGIVIAEPLPQAK